MFLWWLCRTLRVLKWSQAAEARGKFCCFSRGSKIPPSEQESGKPSVVLGAAQPPPKHNQQTGGYFLMGKSWQPFLQRSPTSPTHGGEEKPVDVCRNVSSRCFPLPKLHVRTSALTHQGPRIHLPVLHWGEKSCHSICSTLLRAF